MLYALVLALTMGGPTDELSELRDGPIDFRCDYGQAYEKPSRFVCRNRVVVRRGDLIVCCQRFEGFRSNAGEWLRYVCEGDVRAQRGLERMWADRATFVTATSDLILEGKPSLQRGHNIMHGERIVIDTKYDQARVEKPRGRLDQIRAVEQVDSALFTGKLPGSCPLPAAHNVSKKP